MRKRRVPSHPDEKHYPAQSRRAGGFSNQTIALRRMTSVYHDALSLGVRRWVR